MRRAAASESRSRSTTVAAVPSASARGDVGGVGREDLGGAVDEQVGRGQQGGVLRLGRRRGQDPAGGLGAAAELGDGVRGHAASVGPGRPGSYRTID